MLNILFYLCKYTLFFWPFKRTKKKWRFNALSITRDLPIFFSRYVAFIRFRIKENDYTLKCERAESYNNKSGTEKQDIVPGFLSDYFR